MNSIKTCIKGIELRRALALLLCLVLTGTTALCEEGNPFLEGIEAINGGEYDETVGQEQIDVDEYGGEQDTLLSRVNTNADIRLGYVAARDANFSPYNNNEQDIASINMLMFESLVALDENYRPVPLLADNWTSKGKTWTFNLRKGILFHNGAELTAADVYLSYQRLINADPNSNPYTSRLSIIEDLQVADAYSVTVKSKYAGYVTLYAMTFPIAQSATVDDDIPRGTGPFWCTEYMNGIAIRLEMNPLWWKKDATVQSIACINYNDSGDALTALQTNEIDMLATRSMNAAFSRKMSRFTNTDFATNSYEMLIPNLNGDSPMSDLRIRQAVMYAIDRAMLTSNAYLGMGVQCEVPVNPGSWLYESQSAVYYYSPERALQLLTECGWSDLTGDGKLNKLEGVMLKDLTLKLYTYNESTNQIRGNAANMIATYLGNVGINVEIIVTSKSRTLQRIHEGVCDIALVGVELSDIPNLAPLFEKGGALNKHGFKNEEMEALLNEAKAAATEEDMISVYSRIQMLVVDRLPYLGMLFRTGTILGTRSLGGMSGGRAGNTLRGIEHIATN